MLSWPFSLKENGTATILPLHINRRNALEAGWVFAGYVEVAFEGEAGAGDGAFVEEAADEGDAVRDSTGW
jgi:hypothetical protein